MLDWLWIWIGNWPMWLKLLSTLIILTVSMGNVFQHISEKNFYDAAF